MANKGDHHSLRPHSSVPGRAFRSPARLLAAALPRRLSTLPLLLAALLLGTILLLDAAPAQAQSTPTVTLSADKNPVREGEQVIITGTLSSAPAADFSITATVTSVTAESGDLGSMGFEDKRIDFPAGVTEASFIIPTVEDTDHDDETFIVALGTLPSQVTAGATTSLTITIRDYDDALALVSNVGQTARTTHNPLFSSGTTYINAQQFTTGANAGGYTLTSIEFNMAEAVSVPANIRAELWSSATNGEPDSKLASLAVPSTVGTGNVSFYAPAGTTLAASTSYYAVLYATGATEGRWTRTGSDSEDSGAASGWSIANGLYFRETTATAWTSFTTNKLKIRVNGWPAAPAAGTGVWSATLTPRALSGTAVGCNNTASGNHKCSDATTLTDDDFTYRGETHTIRVLTLNSGRLDLWFTSDLPVYAKNDLVLTVNSAEIPLAEFGGSGQAYAKTSSGLSWTAGTGVTLGLKQRTPTTVTLSAAPNPVTEGSAVTVTVTLSKALASAVQMEATVTAGTAESGDYTALASYPLEIAAGATWASFGIQTNQDDDKDNETLIVTLGSVPSGVEAGETTSLTVTILDDDATALVSNLGQTRSTTFNTGATVQAQGFTTGSASGGYTLSSIEAVAKTAPTAAQRATIRAELWSAATGGGPDSKLADLTVPSTVALGTVSFAAPANTTLAASTTYYLLIYTVGDYAFALDVTASTSEDSGGQTGWSIGDTSWYTSGANSDTPTGATWSEDTTTGVLRIRVKGEAATPTTPLWSATLTAKSTVNGDGCETGAGLAADSQCSDTDNLTDDDFTLGGNAWSVTGVLYRSAVNDMQLFFNRDVRTALDSYNFCVGSTAFAFSSATHPGFDEVARWPNTVGWPVGGTVSLSIVPSGASCPATVSLSPVQNPVTEGSPAEIRIMLSSALATDIAVSLTATAVTAESGDLGEGTFAITIPAGLTVVTLPITTNQDTDTDDETFTVTLGSLPSSVTAGTPTSLTITITDDDRFLVSNVGKATGSSDLTLQPVASAAAQGFTTGANAGGYTVTGIEVVFHTAVGTPANLRVELWGADGNGKPDSSSKVSLTVPSTVGTGTVAFAAPSGTTLAASTTYYVVFYRSGETTGSLRSVPSNLEDSGGESDWTIADAGHYLDTGTWTAWGDSDGYGIRVRGEAASTTLSNNAALTALTAKTATSATGTFTPLNFGTFSSAITAYTASVAGDVTHLKLTPTAHHIDATIKVGKGSSLTAVASGAESAAIPLSTGANAINVEVTAPDGTTKQTYTLTVTRSSTTGSVTLSVASETVSEGVKGPNNEAGLVIVTATLDVGYATAHTCAVTPGSASTAKVRPEGSSSSDWDWRLYAAGVRFNAGATSATFNVAVQDDSAEESAETAIIDIDCTGGVTDSLTLTIEDNDGAPAATLWSATLNVADKTTTEAGCDNGKSGAECSTESVLTDDDFIVGSTTWSVTALLSQKVTGALSMKFNRDVRTALDDYSVCIGARALPFSNAAHTGGSAWAEWDGAAADQHWFAGRDPVLVRISGDCSVSYDADLSGLTAKQQTSETAVTGTSLALSPAFSGATTAYTASVANNVTNVRLTPTVNDPDATVRVGAGNDLHPVRSGETSRTLAVRNNGANSFKVVVTAPDGATMKTYTVTVFRAGSGNVPKVSLSALAEVNEGSSLTVEALLQKPLAGDVTIPLTLTPGTAEPGDYGTLASITIPAGQTSASGVLATTRDADTDDETFTVSLGASLPASVQAGAQPSVRVTIRDLDGAAGTATPPEVTLSVGGNPVREGRGISVFVFLSKPMAGSVTIPITLTPGTAEPGDYGTLASVTVTGIASHPSLGYDGKPFAIGRISTSQDDDLDDETLTVSLGTLPSSVTAGEPSSVTVVINDDDKGPGLPTVSLWASPNPVSEGETVTITARLPYNWLWSDSVTVPVLLNAGTAESGDYGALTPASITILRGQSSGTATVATAEDADYDDETFTASLGPLPATLGPANTRTSVEVTIADDDDDPDAPRAYIVAVPADVLEGGTVKVQVLLTKQPGRDVTLPITVTHVTSEPGDFVPLNPASITIPANKASGEVTLQINWDDDGDDETFTVSLGRLPSSVVRGGPEGPYANFSGPSKVTILDRGSTSSDAIWSATLTPQANALGTDPGCSNIVPSANCNSRSVLTENEFEVGGAASSITLIRTTSTGSEMSVNFSTNVRTALAGYQFCVGARGFPFSSAFSTNVNAAWAPSPALAFTVGATVPLSIVPSGSSCSAGAAPPPNMLVWGSDGWLTVTWRAPDYISTGAIVRWRLKDADPNTAGDQPGAWTPENGVLLRSEQHDAQRATLPPWDCSNCAPLVPGKLYEVGLRLVTATGFSDWGLAGEGVPRAAWPLALSVDSGAIPHGGSVTVTARLGYPAATLMWLRFDTEGDDGAARWGPDCDWEHGATDIIGPGQTETTVKLCATEAPRGVVWSATLTPGGDPAAAVGCFGKSECDARLTDNSFTVGGDAYHITSIADVAGGGLVVGFNDDPNADLQALEFCVGTTGHSIGGSFTQTLTSAGQGWTAGAPVSLKIAESCAASGRTMTVKARILDTDIAATPITVRALGPNPPTAITLSADPQAVANGGPVTVTARLNRPTAPGMTVRLSINGLGAAWWDHCDPPRRYRGTWGGKVIEIPAGAQEATAELCVMWRDGPPLEIAAWSDAPRLQAKTLSLLEPASLVLRSLTVSSTDPAEGLPENSVDLSDASNDYTFSVPRAVSSVTVKPAAAYETTSVKVNGSAVDDATPSVDVPLDVGDNTIRIEVRAPAVPAVREYTLTVTRMEASTDKETQVLERPECEAETGPLCGIALSAGSESVAFSPDFAPDTTSYQATVPAGTTSVTLTPDFAEGTSVFAGSRNGGTTYTRPTRVRPSGTAVELALAPDGGSTEVWLMVSGSGGMTTYSIHVTEARPEPKTYSVSAASTAAEGANATLTVTLSEAAPTGGVALTVSAGYSGGSTATADDVGSITSPVTVPAGNTTLDISIPTVDDDVDEDNETFTVTISANAQGWEKAGDGRDTATVTITDDDTAGVTVTPTTLSVAEDGTATYTVTLDSRPTADVTVTVTSGDDGAASVSPASYTFTPSGWNLSQIFVVSGVADDDTDEESVTISHSAASSDANYHGIAVASVAVSVTDDTPEQQQQTAEPVEIPGPVVNLQLTAKGKKVIVTWEAPASGGAVDNYIVHLKPDGGGDGKTHRPRAGKTTTTFRNLEPGAAYRVWVRAQNEAGKGERVHASVTLPDGVVEGGEGEQQQVARTFSVSATASAAEGGNAALTITLSEAAPAGGAAFTVTAGYGGDSTATSDDVGSITSPVTVAEGDTTLDISIPTADDAVDEDDETFTITVAATTSGWEKEGDGRDTATVTITDDDTAGVTVTPTTLSVSEDGSATYTVVLDSRPTADVTVTASSGDAGASSVAPASHTFTPSDWSTPQTFTVSGVADEDRDNESVTIGHDAASSDGKYGGIAVDSVAVSVADTTPEPAQEPESASCPEETEPPVPGQTEPYNVCITPGDGTLTVTWTVAPREGFEDIEIRHALRWSQEPGVWANPTGPNAVGPNDGITMQDGMVGYSVEDGVYTYTITGLKNGVATGVFIRSFTGGNYNEDSPESSEWVRLKGENTTPKAAE